MDSFFFSLLSYGKIPGFPFFSFLFGAILGSFANMVIYRYPRKENWFYPPSRCIHCKTPLRFYENIPIFSYLYQKGRCGHCGSPIPIRYLVVELWLSFLFFLLPFTASSWGSYFFLGVFFLLLVILAGVDMEHYILPDLFTISLFLFSLLYAYLFRKPPLSHLLLDISFGPFFLLALRFGYYLVRREEGLGLGDVKLMGGIGGFLGWEGALFTLLLGSFFGLIPALVFLFRREKKVLRKAIPFGPFLALSAQVFYFVRFFFPSIVP